MNSQLEKLYNKSFNEVVDTCAYTGIPNVTLELDLEKFAELIIRECGHLAEAYSYEVKMGTINFARTTVHEFMLEYFGVKYEQN